MVAIERGEHDAGNAAGTVKQALNTFYNTTKTALANVPGLGSAEAKAEQYVKECWNHMVRNEVEQARDAYDKLVEAYEAMEDGDAKKEMYYEVRDIYKRISDF